MTRRAGAQGGYASPDEIAQLTQRIHDLRQQIDDLAVLGQATGLLMGHFGMDSDAAAEHLTSWADLHEASRLDIARSVVAAADLESSVPFDLPPGPAGAADEPSTGRARHGRQRLSALIERLDEAW